MSEDSTRELTDDEYHYMNIYFGQMDVCEESPFNITGRYLHYKCRKLMCHKCGGYNHSLHRKKYKLVKKRIDGLDIPYLRQIVFTIPEHLRKKHFLTKDGLNKLFGVVKRLIRREFGELVEERRTKNGIKKKYRLDKKVVAFLHLFGRTGSFNPHINVLIFENNLKGNSLKLSMEKIEGIKKSYHRALQASLNETLPELVVDYSYRIGKKNVRTSIWYMSTPLDPEIPENIITIDFDIEMMDLMVLELRRFQHIRFWGQLSNSEYKKHLQYIGNEYIGQQNQKHLKIGENWA